MRVQILHNPMLTHDTLRQYIANHISIGDTIQVEKRSSDDYKFLQFVDATVIGLYDRYVLVERNGYR